MKSIYIIRDTETGNFITTNEGAICFSGRRFAELALSNSVTWDKHCQMEFLKKNGYKDLVQEFKDLSLVKEDLLGRGKGISYDLEKSFIDVLSQVQDKLFELGYYKLHEELVKDTPNKRFYIEQVTSFKTKEEKY